MGELSRRADAPAPVPVDPSTLPMVEVEELVKEPEAALIARGVAYAREYRRIEHHPTMLLKGIAAVCVALRVQHGDMLGKSHLYRQVIAQIYRDAGVDEKTQTAVRYHLGNLLRRTMTPRELKSHGLLATSPLERLQDTRATDAVIVKAAKALTSASAPALKAPDANDKPTKPSKKSAKTSAPSAGTDIKATADQLRLASMAAGILRQLSADTIDDHMTDGQRAKLDEELDAVQKTITALRKHTRKARSKA
ncbi:hypothetical protein [Streptomyces zaomyceticus]|uniref:hypothetical protein n=1 Tax=Streptomyces zaomyceticus TaxID=68286 RepID=UPI00342D22B2